MGIFSLHSPIFFLVDAEVVGPDAVYGPIAVTETAAVAVSCEVSDSHAVEGPKDVKVPFEVEETIAVVGPNAVPRSTAVEGPR